MAFWQQKSLAEMSTAEWEALCDGCGKCCLHKLEDEDTGECFYTRVACRYLDENSSRCGCYSERLQRVPDCTKLTLADIDKFHWLPASCAYRLLANRQPLPDWHPLVSGDPDSVHRAGASVRGRCLSEEQVHPDDLEAHIVHWVDCA